MTDHADLLKRLDWYETAEDWPGDLAAIEVILEARDALKEVIAERDEAREGWQREVRMSADTIHQLQLELNEARER